MNADAHMSRPSATVDSILRAAVPAATVPPAAGRVELTVPAEPGAPGRARRATAGALADWDPDRRAAALLVVSELVTNAVRHGSSGPADAIQVRIRRRGGRVRIEVEDAGALGGTVRLAGVDPDRRCGWGLPIVAALTDRWGVACVDGDTVVWCELEAT